MALPLAALPVLMIALASSAPRVTELAQGTRKASPSYLASDDQASAHAAAALVAEVPMKGISAELLLAVAYVESRYDPRATSRKVAGGARKTGVWASSEPAGRGPRYCGPLQTAAGHSWARCLAMRELGTGYAAGAAELVRWRTYCRKLRARDLTSCSLDGHVGGYAAAKRPGSTSYTRHVLAKMRSIIRRTRRWSAPRRPADLT